MRTHTDTVLRLAAIVVRTGRVTLAGCGEMATVPEQQDYGPQPTLPAPHPTIVPTVNTAAATGWKNGVTPIADPILMRTRALLLMK